MKVQIILKGEINENPLKDIATIIADAAEFITNNVTNDDLKLKSVQIVGGGLDIDIQIKK